MSDLKETASSYLEEAKDIFQDKYSSFMDLDRPMRLAILGIVGLALVAILAFSFNPSSINIIAKIDNTLGDARITVKNIGDEPLKEVKIILDGKYTKEIDVIEPDKLVIIKMIEFTNLRGDGPPPDDYRPDILEVRSEQGRKRIDLN